MIVLMLISLGVLIFALLSFYSYFLRDPERSIPDGDFILAPADGKVIDVLLLEKKQH